ncbi:unnamed protein product [Oikopleura dioica]|uniref:Uncharacterized protein n=1 Tax=Oikopleura dioica TaxID=34765 RepID=E4XRB9_OIKDI|nr:unnamed protein product [Oikopleura dioica]
MTETQNSQNLSCGQIFAKWLCCRDDEDFTKQENYQDFETAGLKKKLGRVIFIIITTRYLVSESFPLAIFKTMKRLFYKIF